MKKPRILIIDDDQAYLEKLSLLLADVNAQLHYSTSAENASFKVSEHKPDLILLDNVLPKLNGVEVISIFKELSPESSILLMSSTFNIQQIALAYKNGCDYILDKKDINSYSLGKIIEAKGKAKGQNSVFIELLDRFFGTNNKQKYYNIAIVEDDNMFSFKLRWLIENSQINKNLINEYPDKSSFLKSLGTNTPEIVFLDYYLQDEEAMDILAEINVSYPKTKVIAVSAQRDPRVALEMKKHNCYGYVIKNENWESTINDYLKELMV